MDRRGVGGWTDVHVDPHEVLDALPRAIIVTDPAGAIVVWNQRAEELYGWAAEDVLGRPVSDVLVPPQSRSQADEILDVVRAGVVWEGDFTVMRRDGSPVRVWVIDRPILDAEGQTLAIVGASEDVSERRLLEQRAADLTQHLRLALQAGGLGTFRWDMATGVTEWDASLEALFGVPAGTFEGSFEAWVALIHPDDREQVVRTVEAAVETRAPYSVEHRVVWPDGSVHWIHGSGQVTVGEDGAVTGTIGCSRDITAQVLAEQERQRLTLQAVHAADQERINRERLEFLAQINDALALAKNPRELMVNVARAAVPRLGDWCSVYVLPDPHSRIPDIETAHIDPAMVAHARELQARFPYDPEAPVGMAHVIRTGTAEFHPAIDRTLVTSLAVSEAERDVIAELELSSSIGVPLIKRGRVLGGMQLVMTRSNRVYTDDDLTLAEAVGSRVASSLENLRLSEEQRSIATTLQASLLPQELPDIPGVDLAVRYWAAGDGIEVGGDFYDVFRISDGSWALVIGDVCGKGPAAAAITGMARHTIASAAWHGDDEVKVLTNLNRAILERGSETFCTVIYGTVQPGPGGGATFTFACGGHPLPIVARDGAIATAGASGTLIGVLDDVRLVAHTVDLRPGDAVVLYTDGVTDVAPPHGITEEGFIGLVGRAVEQTTSSEQLADRLHADLSSILAIDQRDDDIALLVLRIPATP